MEYLDKNREYWYNERGYLCYRRNQDVRDGHGGHGPEHRREMEMIAEAVARQQIAEAIPEIKRAATEQAYNGILEALSFDVTSAVNIGFENAESIFKDKKTQKVLADAVMKEVKRQLKGTK